MQNQVIYELKNVSKSYPGVKVFEDTTCTWLTQYGQGEKPYASAAARVPELAPEPAHALE